MRTSEKTEALDEALATAQGELKNPGKGKTAKVQGTARGSGKEYEYSYKYADIADGIDIVRPVLAKHKIAVIQGTRIEGGCVILETRLSHKGEWIESDYPVGKADQSHQDLGSCMTYARRYSLFPMLNIAAEEDTDGQGASSAAPERQTPGNTRAKWQSDQIRNLNLMEKEQEFENWMVVNEDKRSILKKEEPELSEVLEKVIENTAKRVNSKQAVDKEFQRVVGKEVRELQSGMSAEDFDGSSDH